MSPTSDLFLAAADLEHQLHIHRPGAPPLPAETSAATLAAAALLALAALTLLGVLSHTRALPIPPSRTPYTTSVTTDAPAPANVIHMEYDPLR